MQEVGKHRASVGFSRKTSVCTGELHLAAACPGQQAKGKGQSHSLFVKPLEEHFVCLSPSNTRQKLESLLVTMGDKKSQTSKMKQAYS